MRPVGDRDGENIPSPDIIRPLLLGELKEPGTRPPISGGLLSISEAGSPELAPSRKGCSIREVRLVLSMRAVRQCATKAKKLSEQGMTTWKRLEKVSRLNLVHWISLRLAR